MKSIINGCVYGSCLFGMAKGSWNALACHLHYTTACQQENKSDIRVYQPYSRRRGIINEYSELNENSTHTKAQMIFYYFNIFFVLKSTSFDQYYEKGRILYNYLNPQDFNQLLFLFYTKSS